MTKNWIEQLNALGAKKEPCFFVIDYTARLGEVYLMQDLKDQGILFNFPSSKIEKKKGEKPVVNFQKKEIDFKTYQESFNKVMAHLKRGDSYLVNLTFATAVNLNLRLEEVYLLANAKYKIKYQNKWVCFSPETFITIQDNCIATYPMKGTINADIPNAHEILLNDAKERAEHSTIVDLLRNDLSMVAQKVRLKRLMYIEKVKTHQKDILQMSSEIIGDLEDDWHRKMGTILHTLLPAGSICGAPKKKTLEIINEAENYHRGFYTGIAGYYDGDTLDTCVLIRFLENTPQGLVYKSGGGITAQSDLQKEYDELNQKIYVPIY